MPGGRHLDDTGAGASPRQTLLERLRFGPPPRDGANARSLRERLSKALLKPPRPGSESESPDKPRTVEELEAVAKSADDKERLIGLIAAPLAAGIAFLINRADIANDPSSLLPNGQVNKLHVAVSLYNEVLLALIALSVLMIVMSMLRKRLYLGIVMALYGLTLFNLHDVGFAIPYVLCAAWLLVRAYRFQRDLREAGGGRSPTPDGPRSPRPRGNKRYTPPTS